MAKEKKIFNFYEDLAKKDLISKLQPEFANGSMFLRDDGVITRASRMSHNTPWIHIKQAPNRHCGLYQTYFQRFGFIHSTCQECWKVVVRPRTLIELHKLLELQKVLDLPSKCGIEKRDTVHGLYGGYFYNDSLKQGREIYKVVRSNVDLNISPEVPVILKRACTEFELEMGPSDEWEVSQDQKDLEYLLSDLIDYRPRHMPQPDHLKDSVFRSWIHWAYACGDKTYFEYTGSPLFKPFVTYHEEGKKDGKKEKHSAGSPKLKAGPVRTARARPSGKKSPKPKASGHKKAARKASKRA